MFLLKTIMLQCIWESFTAGNPYSSNIQPCTVKLSSHISQFSITPFTCCLFVSYGTQEPGQNWFAFLHLSSRQWLTFHEMADSPNVPSAQKISSKVQCKASAVLMMYANLLMERKNTKVLFIVPCGYKKISLKHFTTRSYYSLMPRGLNLWCVQI